MHSKQSLINEFIKLYFNKKCWTNIQWLGVPIYQSVFDLFNIAEIVFITKPQIIIEIGTNKGGFALFLASLLNLMEMKEGFVIAIDKKPKPEINHPLGRQIVFVQGDSLAYGTILKVKYQCNNDKTIMLLLNSNHKMEHVLQEIAAYSPLVSVGHYMIVQDGCVNNHPVMPKFGPGPYEAVEEFIKGNNEFIIERNWEEKHLCTFHPNGYLRRIK